MVKKLDFVGWAFSSLLNSPKYQKSSHFSKNGNKKAFSVAEAMIALLIGSLALGAMAPMISKQLKQNNFNNTQFTILEKRMVPSGAVMYFDLDKCPVGWSELTKFYPKSANSFIRNKSGTTRGKGHWQQNAAPNITGFFSTTDEYGYYTTKEKDYNGAFVKQETTVSNSSQYQVNGGRGSGGSVYNFDASRSSETYGRKDEAGIVATEIRPDNIALLACRKD